MSLEYAFSVLASIAKLRFAVHAVSTVQLGSPRVRALWLVLPKTGLNEFCDLAGRFLTTICGQHGCQTVHRLCSLRTRFGPRQRCALPKRLRGGRMGSQQ